jgi:peptide/nickel transport system substrate-binding protein
MKVAELIKLSLSQIGVTVNVQSVESKTRDNAVNTGKYELLLINSGGMGGDPTICGRSTERGAPRSKGWSDPQIASILEAQSVELDPYKRKECVYEAQKLIADQVPMIMLHGALDNFVYRPAKYDHWMFRYDHSKCDHNKLSYVIRTESEQAGQTT